MTENERVRMIRQDVGHTMREFGAVLGVGSSTISDIENGRRNLTTPMSRLICEKYHICEAWLRTGEGPMKAPEPSGDDLDAVLDKWGLPREFRGLFIAYRNLKTDAQREAVCQFIRDAAEEIASEQEQDDGEYPSDEQLEREAREEAEEYFRLRLAEKREIEADAKARGLTGTGQSSTNSGRGGGVA